MRGQVTQYTGLAVVDTVVRRGGGGDGGCPVGDGCPSGFVFGELGGFLLR